MDSNYRLSSLPELFQNLGQIVVCEQDGDVAMGIADLEEIVDRLCQGFEEWGAKPGDRIAIWLPNGVPYIALMWATSRLGLVLVSINTRYRSSEVADIVGRSGARLLVVDPGFLGIDFSGILAEIKQSDLLLEGVISLDDNIELPWPTIRWSDLIKSERSLIDRSDRDLPWIVFSTSGTTSQPKLVLHNQSGPADHARDLAPTFGHVAMAAVPMCGVFGYSMLLGAMGAGSDLITMPIFDADLTGTAIEKYGVNTFHGSDEMLDRIIRVGTDLSSLDPVGYARFNNALENVPEDAAKAGLNAIGLYGMSEVHALYSRRSLRPKERMSIPGGSLVSVEASARVVNPDTSKVLEIGEEGELQLRGPSLFAGYLADGGESIDSVLTSKHFDHDWFRTGDLARMEDEVTFEYLARLGDVLRLGGFLVNPAEIEECLLSQEGVDAVQVVGVDLSGGPKAVAFVVSEQSIDAQKLRNECRNRLASFKVPALIIQLQEFPTTESANGTKIQKVRLRDIAIEALTNN